MRVGRKIGLVASIGVLMTLATTCPAQAVDLLAALESGQVWAQFWGAGPTAVQGTVGRSPYGPQSVTVSPGTQFWGQRQGVQGMSTWGSVPIDLSEQRIAHVRIPAACTNIGLRTPTPADRMVPARCPDMRMARLATVIGKRKPSHPAAQLAVWAVANNPPRGAIDQYLHDTVSAQQPGATMKREKLVSTAVSLLREAGLSPSQFRMFQ